MKRSLFTETQIVSTLKEADAGRSTIHPHCRVGASRVARRLIVTVRLRGSRKAYG